MTKITVATVYRTGGEYRPEYVEKLKRAFERHLPVEHDFVCLTNHSFADYCVPLIHEWEGWWSKIELFRPGLLTGPTIFSDLDMIYCGDLSRLLNPPHDFMMMTDPHPLVDFNSSLMAWDGDYSFLYETFRKDVEKYMRLYEGMPLLGDQGFIEVELKERGVDLGVWQDYWPKDYDKNYQEAIALRGEPWRGSSVIWWTGQPKPHRCPPQSLITENWI